MIRFACGGCDKEYNVKPELAGRQVKCKKCGTVFAVPVPQPATRPADPLGLNLDLGALGPLDDPALGAALGSPLGPSPLGIGQYRPQKKKRAHGKKWLIFGVGGLGAAIMVAVVAILIATLTAGGPRPNGNAAAYLPTNWSAAASVRVRHLLDRASAVPQLKSQIEPALADSMAKGVDMRLVDEILFAQDGGVTFATATFAQPVDMAQMLKKDRPTETYRGMQLYVGTPQAQANMNVASPAPGAPKTLTMYSVAPTSQLLVGVSDPGRLKAAIDQSFERGSVGLDLPKGHDLAIRVKNLNEVSGQLGAPPNPMLSGVTGLTATLQVTDNLTFDVVLDTEDAQTAAGFEQQVKFLLALAGTKQPPANPGAPSPNLLDAIKIAVNGNQFRVNGSVPVNQLAAALPQPGQGPPRTGLPFGAGGAGPAGPGPLGEGTATPGFPGGTSQVPGQAPTGSTSASGIGPSQPAGAPAPGTRPR